MHFTLLFHAVLCKLIIPYSTGVRAAAKISAGGVGSPYNQLNTVSYSTCEFLPVGYPTSSTDYGSEDI